MTDPTTRSANQPLSRCTFVTGPSGAEQARWLQETIHTLRADWHSSRYAMLSTAETAMEMERLARVVPHVTVRSLTLPCLCCPATADLPRQVRAFTSSSGADCLFVMLPALAATGLIADFDAVVRWPREIVLCLDAAWTKARHTDTLSFFQFQLITAADRVVDAPGWSGGSGRHVVRCGPRVGTTRIYAPV